MRRMIVIALLLVSLCGCTCALAGCGDAEPETRKTRFTVEWADEDAAVSTVLIATDTETGCQYLCWQRYNAGGMTLLVDQHGMPLLADGYSRSEGVQPSRDWGE